MFTSSLLKTFVYDSKNVYVDKTILNNKTIRDDEKSRDDKIVRENKVIYDKKFIRANKKKISRIKQRKIIHKINKFWIYDNFYNNSFSTQSLIQF